MVRDNHLSNLTYPGGAKMALIRSGKTLFKGMTFEDIVRFQFDIETTGLNPEAGRRPKILLIAVADNRGLVELLEGDEDGHFGTVRRARSRTRPGRNRRA